MIKRIAIVGTGLIGASIALALRAAGFDGTLTGIDKDPAERTSALTACGFTSVHDASDPDDLADLAAADIIVLATPVLAILDWMARLAPILHEHQLVTDVGSTKSEIAAQATALYNQVARAHFLPGHPMAGKESGGAALADPTLFHNAMWLFTPIAPATPLEAEWRALIERFGARTRDLAPAQHDELCAWVSHLPQMLSTALAALLEDTFSADPNALADLQAIGGRALRETTRLGASPYSMWRDVALTNTAPIAATLLALEQRLAHLRENLRSPELREQFRLANQFRAPR